jgi:hypothetical protein
MGSIYLPDGLTVDEVSAIRALDRLARRWPKTLMIASMAGNLEVLRLTEGGFHPMKGEGLDQGAIVYSVPPGLIDNTGGDW